MVGLMIQGAKADVVMMLLAKRLELRDQTPALAARALEKVAKYQGLCRFNIELGGRLASLVRRPRAAPTN
jgi:hypothetical protein